MKTILKNLKQETDSKCQVCKEYKEIIDHLRSIFAGNKYINKAG
jgi:hypothetical protein